MNIITRASVKERIHVEQIIRSQPHMHNSGLVDIVTIPVRKCLGLSEGIRKRFAAHLRMGGIFNANVSRKSEVVLKAHCAYMTRCGIIQQG